MMKMTETVLYGGIIPSYKQQRNECTGPGGPVPSADTVHAGSQAHRQGVDSLTNTRLKMGTDKTTSRPENPG